ncbi:sugar phosphate isomerase/epimerase family protein [Paenibacillus sp. FJAT-27812]|uniref:sugar phosphate isomerase/epimerase family protein n=1 Tax=Paenibacillus sp. FJAT-27812 TaxID=1684143 RepID=UPI0006A7B095|nr:sugar phosphate isomerase/epimerase family protein [Paenibacillus sp. FJAT-27812]
MSYLSISTWSLHRNLGPLRWTAWDEKTSTPITNEQEQPQVITLLELPGEAAARGYQAIEVCHFHFPSTEPAYLEQLRNAFNAAGIKFDTLLLDYGDLTTTDATRKSADLSLIRHWIDTASLSGAKQIRIVAGEAQPTDEEALQASADSLAELAQYAVSKGVRVITENFKALTSTSDSSLKLLAQAGEHVGFITDFGNYHGEGKLAEISATAPLSVSVHVKPTYDPDGFPDTDELITYLNQVQEVGYNGAYVLIYDGPGDMWEGLNRVKTIVEPFILTAR